MDLRPFDGAAPRDCGIPALTGNAELTVVSTKKFESASFRAWRDGAIPFAAGIAAEKTSQEYCEERGRFGEKKVRNRHRLGRTSPRVGAERYARSRPSWIKRGRPPNRRKKDSKSTRRRGVRTIDRDHQSHRRDTSIEPRSGPMRPGNDSPHPRVGSPHPRVGSPEPRGGSANSHVASSKPRVGWLGPRVGCPNVCVGSPKPRGGSASSHVASPKPRVGWPGPRVRCPDFRVGSAESRGGSPIPPVGPRIPRERATDPRDVSPDLRAGAAEPGG
jgi:hypothetical protein